MSKEGRQSVAGSTSVASSGFVGRYDYALDPKKRLTIPSLWRSIMGNPEFVYVMPDPREKCVNIIPPVEMESRLEEIRKKALFDPVLRPVLQKIGACSEMPSVDVQGRSDGEAAAYVVVTASALEEKKDEIIRLAPEILLGTKFDDEKAIGKILRQLRRAKERGTMGLGARIYARRRAQAALSERGLRVDILLGLAQIRHLQKLDDAYAKDGAV